MRVNGDVDRQREYLYVCEGVVGVRVTGGVNRLCEYLNVCVGVLWV